MTTTTAVDLDKAKLDPASVFRAPKDVLQSQGLSPEDKKSILLRWQEDAEALMRATGEGMPPEGQRRSPAELLLAVHEAIETLDGQAKKRCCCG